MHSDSLILFLTVRGGSGMRGFGLHFLRLSLRYNRHGVAVTAMDHHSPTVLAGDGAVAPMGEGGRMEGKAIVERPTDRATRSNA